MIIKAEVFVNVPEGNACYSCRFQAHNKTCLLFDEELETEDDFDWDWFKCKSCQDSKEINIISNR